MLIPLVLSLAILFSTAERTNIKPHYTADIAVSEQGNILLANKGTQELRMISSEGKLLKSWELSMPATGVATFGDRAYVTCSQASGELHCVSLEGEMKTLFTTKVGMGACAPVVSHDGKKVYICNRYKATVSEVDATSGELLREVKVLREPCAASLSKDGKTLYINNFLPSQRADVDYVAADVSVIDCETFTKIKDIKLCNGSNALRGNTLSEDGKYLFISHNLGRYQVPTSQLQQGWMNTNAVSVISTQNNEYFGTFSLDEPDRGAGGVWDIACNGDFMVVSQSGTHDVSIIDYKALVERLEAYEDKEVLDHDLYLLRDIRTRMAIVGNGPRNMALKDGVVYLPAYFSDNLNIINLREQSLNHLAYNPDRVESAIDRGERAFNDAALCYQNWQSCNGCHPGEGRTDGLNWDNLNDGTGNPKNCKSMMKAHFTAPSMISGIRETPEKAVRAGFKYIQFNEVGEEIATCVDEYLKNLKPVPSPYLVNGELSEKAKRGQTVFQKYGCGSCHSGEYYTNCQKYVIGEDVEFEQGWDTPTLVEVWRTAPYLFDGRAATMEEVFSLHRHGLGKKDKISQEEIDALVEYVNSL